MVALLLLVPLGIIMGLLIWHVPNDVKTDESSNPMKVRINSSEIPSSEGGVSEDIKDNQEAIASPETTVSLIIDGPTGKTSYKIPVKIQGTVADVLLSAKTKGLEISYQDFGGELGLFVESINGVTNNQKTNKYWTLYVNGQRANTGASSTPTKEGDVIEWRYEQIMENGI